MLAGGFMLLVGIIRSRETSLAFSPPPTSAISQTKQADYVGGEPVKIIIPSLKINLPVIPGYYNQQTKQWTLTVDKVQYAAITPEPNNQSGNTFLYGHYRSNVFASLHTIKPGAQVEIDTNNNHKFIYQLSEVKIVSPDDSKSVFEYKGKPELTVQTCTGLFFQNRQLFTFDLVKAA
jgi:LPXTG-site transpeptidase (sortase) family protein